MLCSFGGYEIVCSEDDENDPSRHRNIQTEPINYQRARVLCSYDAKDNSELNLIANEVSWKLIFVKKIKSF